MHSINKHTERYEIRLTILILFQFNHCHITLTGAHCFTSGSGHSSHRDVKRWALIAHR
ncbi:protein of unknown function [Nocardia cyriacigeorgica GUH-2]|uniref:Uncharacterized protein n=1 Tax=Nocardia cyriacigeorgica (strain GUH-2) TaxID=1127134 RepID=H6R752_NOCCG|nr:protein of unknown function [Nocardia cyriacigeorgica GUH-2]